MKIVQTNIFLYFFLMVLAASGIAFPIVWPQLIGFYAFIVMMAIGGLGVSFYIHHTKSSGKQLVCPVGSDCNAVITSEYSKFLGVSLEYWGMLYYILILISYLGLIFVPEAFSGLVRLGLSLLTAGAFLFSLYLLFVQAYLLRQWCIWCLLSAALSITIFITSLASASVAITFLAGVTAGIDFVHTLGFGLGVGGVSVALFLFSRFLRDSNINNVELKTLKSISEIIWLGLVLALVSQFISFVVDPVTLSGSAVFLVQTIALLVSGISGAVLMIIFAPLLTAISFGQNEEEVVSPTPLDSLEKPFFAVSAIALSSWYFAFVTEYLTSLDFLTLLFVYAVVLFFAVVLSLIWEKRIER